jgi:exoribonuclease R
MVAPAGVAAVPGLATALHLQDQLAQCLKGLRRQHGALSLETIQARPVFSNGNVRDLQVEEKNRATDIIEDLMIAANSASAEYLNAHGYPTIRRVVRTPRRWDRIVTLAAEKGAQLPPVPDSLALENFLTAQKAADPLHYPDLSLAVIKLLGPGEYVAETPGSESAGHFGLAVKDYTHSTAPNRRYTDLATQRLIKAAIAGAPSPYSVGELTALALHCTQQEDAANKVERQVTKSAAALLLQDRIGENFDALVTGAADKGTWVRLLALPVEGRLVQGAGGVDVGDRIGVQLAAVDVEQGYIDFRRSH